MPSIHYLLPSRKDLAFWGEGPKGFVSFAKDSDIIWADAARCIPLPDNSVEVLYTSHMVEHLDREKAKRFMQEAYRVLAPNGIIRIAVPDLKKLVSQYITEGNADSFIERTLLTRQGQKTVLDRLKYLIVGERHHQWMYDGSSMVRLLSAMGFKEPRIFEPGSTIIPNPAELNLFENADESVYVEAYK